MVPEAAPPPEHEERAIPFEAVFNFRDLGGYQGADGRTVRWRTLFRADGLNRLTDVEVARVRSLGIVTVMDLRTPEEITNHGRFAELETVTFHHLPVFDVVPDWSDLPGSMAPGFLADRYAEMLDGGAGAVAGVLRLLTKPETLPAVFHCAAGKDRTGIVAALVLSLLGVDRATVVVDYALSHEPMARMDQWILRKNPDYAERLAARPVAVAEARPETMERFLAALDVTYGSVAGLAEHLGITPAEVEALRANLLT
jgi:protein-tyrosine phosphatase